MNLIVIATITTIISILISLIAIFIGRKNITNFIKSIRPKESIAIFGPKTSGKTTLIRYLQGKPLPEQHFDTFGAQSVGKIVYDLSGNETYFFRSREMYDVGGEHIPQWEAIIKSQNPNGIIYIVDTTQPENDCASLKQMYEIYNKIRTDVLDEGINLKSLLILLNKCDLWGQNPDMRSEKISIYRTILSEPLNLFKSDFGDDLQIYFGSSSLTHSEYSQLNNEVLRNFAIALAN